MSNTIPPQATPTAPAPEATAEETAIGMGRLAQLDEGHVANEKGRRDCLRQDVFYVLRVVIYFFGIVALLGVASIAWYYLLPDDMQYLSDSRISAIRTIIFSGGGGAVMTSFVTRGAVRQG